MKIEMKKYLLVLIVFLNVNLGFSQCLPPAPPPDTDCPDCEYLITWDTVECEYSYTDYDACAALTCPEAVPVDSSLLSLIILGISLGIYKIHQNKKRQFEN